jgi:hypothetical protein
MSSDARTFDGKPCRKCGGTLRYLDHCDHDCVACQLARGARYRQGSDAHNRASLRWDTAHREQNRQRHALRNGAEYRAAMLQAQLGLCAFCELPLELSEACADHDHSCCSASLPYARRCGTCERGVVHNRCNITIGWVEKYSALVAAYREKYRG